MSEEKLGGAVEARGILAVNGEKIPYEPITVQQLIASLARTNPEREDVAVAVNGEIVVRDAWKSTQLKPGDQVEIIHAVAGG